jgi:hypothetical protein
MCSITRLQPPLDGGLEPFLYRGERHFAAQCRKGRSHKSFRMLRVHRRVWASSDRMRFSGPESPQEGGVNTPAFGSSPQTPTWPLAIGRSPLRSYVRSAMAGAWFRADRPLSTIRQPGRNTFRKVRNTNARSPGVS